MLLITKLTCPPPLFTYKQQLHHLSVLLSLPCNSNPTFPKMSDRQPEYSTSETRRRGTGRRATTVPPEHEPVSASAPAHSPAAPCGACKFLRRKCITGCIFAPHFSSDQGAARFAAVHKVFGASNVSKLLLHIPVNRRHDAVVTISYEAQARLSDPVYGCVSTILALQQQVYYVCSLSNSISVSEKLSLLFQK